MFKVFAEGGRQGSDGVRGNGTDVRNTSQRRRGSESMGDYYRRTGQSALGGNARTRGTLAGIRQRG